MFAAYFRRELQLVALRALLRRRICEPASINAPASNPYSRGRGAQCEGSRLKGPGPNAAVRELQPKLLRPSTTMRSVLA